MLYDMMPATFSEFRSYPFPDSKEGKEGKERSVVEVGSADNEGMIWKEFFSPFFSGRFVKKILISQIFQIVYFSQLNKFFFCNFKGPFTLFEACLIYNGTLENLYLITNVEDIMCFFSILKNVFNSDNSFFYQKCPIVTFVAKPELKIFS